MDSLSVSPRHFPAVGKGLQGPLIFDKYFALKFINTVRIALHELLLATFRKDAASFAHRQTKTPVHASMAEAFCLPMTNL